MDMSDGSLLERWRNQGDPDAFRDLVVRYGGLVFGTCRRVLGNAADAEDVTQECFLKLAREPRRLKGPLGGWLHRVATHCAIDRQRSERRRQAREESYAASRAETAEPQWDEVQIYVDEAIAQLPHRLREPLVRHFLQGHSHEAIGQDIGITRSAVSHRIAQGIDTVRDSLRRKGVVVAPPALAAMLAANLAEATPLTPALTAALGRMAVSGVTKAGATAIVAGALAAKLASVALVLLVIGIGAYSWWRGVPQEPPPIVNTISAPSFPDLQTAPNEQSAPAKSPGPVDIEPSAAVSGGVVIRGELQVNPSGSESAPVCRILAQGDGWTRETASRSDGTYELHVPPGACRISCEPPEGMVVLRPDRTRGWAYDETFQEGGEVNFVNFELHRSVNVWGRVVDEGGSGVSDATVGCRGDPRTAKTDKEGYFRLCPVSYGDSYLMALAEGYAATSAKVYSDGKDIRDVTFILAPEAVVSGRVVDEDGAPLPGSQVRLSMETHLAKGESVILPAIDADEEGMFTIRRVPAGRGYFTVMLSDAENAKQCIRPKNEVISVEAGQSVSDVDLIVPSARKCIAGYVRDGDGKAIAGVEIQFPNTGTACGRTEADGSFRIAHLDAEKVSLIFKHPDHGSVSLEDVVAGTEDLDIVLAAGWIQGTVYDADSGTSFPVFEVLVTDLVLDGGTHERPTASFTPNDPQSGSYTVKGIPLGVATVWAFAEGHAPQRRDGVRIFQGRATNVDFRLPPGCAVEGRIGIEGNMWFSDGQSVIVHVAPDGDGKQTTLFDRYIGVGKMGGPYRLDLDEGDYRIAVSGNLEGPAGYRCYTSRRSVHIVRGQTTRLDVVLGGQCILHGRVGIPADKGPYHTFLSVREASAPDVPALPPLRSNAFSRDIPFHLRDDIVEEQASDGRYELLNLPAGTYKVTGTLATYVSETPTYRYASKTVTLVSGQTTEVYLTP